MWKNAHLLFSEKAQPKRLAAYGFTRQGNGWLYAADIMDGTFRLEVMATEQEFCGLRVIDAASGEEYAPAYVSAAVGSYIAEVRTQCEQVLDDILVSCCGHSRFKGEQTLAVMEHIRESYGDEAEFLWESTPNNAIFRDAASRKWYAVLMTVERSRLGLPGEGAVEVMNLRAEAERVSALLDGERYLTGYHMNKKYWYTLVLDGRVPPEEIYQRVEESRANVLKKHGRKNKKK